MRLFRYPLLWLPLLIVVSLLCVFTVTGAASTIETGRRKYVPVYAQKLRAATPDRRGTIKGDYNWAAASPSVRVAAARWKQFLGKYAAPDYELGDGFEARLISVARYELMRVLYLLGRTAEGDKLLKQLDPLDLSRKDADGQGVRAAHSPKEPRRLKP